MITFPPATSRIRSGAVTRLSQAAAACGLLTAGADALGQPAGYLPDDQCASCHREIYDAYQQVGMARSLARPRPETAIGDFDGSAFFHEPSQRYYQMVHEDGAFAMRRYQLDENGRQINVLRQPIDWVIGSGEHSRGYLYQTALGELYELPIAWYSQEGRWGMAPGYDHADHDGVTRLITRDCMFCHNAFPAAAAGSDAHGQPQVFASDLPEGTGCQRCHGPGAEHVRLANDLNATVESVIASITNPARLPPDRRDEVCYQCHLQPTSRRSSLVRRFGRSDYSYRPGEPLGDYMVHVDFGDEADRADRFEINHHPYRLRQSTCYRAGDGRLNCLTCHDPHRKIAPADVQAHYRQACLSCHGAHDCGLPGSTAAQPDVPAQDCITCHMPKRRTQDAVGVVMTDHRIQRTAPPDPTGPLAESADPPAGEAFFYFDAQAPTGPEAAVYLAMPGAADGDPASVDALRDALPPAMPATMEPYIALGAAQLGAGRFREALGTFTMVQARDRTSSIALANLGVALAGLEATAQAVTPLSEAIELDPSMPDAHYNLATNLARLGRNDEAVGLYREALRLRPNYAKAWLNLGNCMAREGLFEQAADAYRSALSIEPGLAAASRNLGTALRYQGLWEQAMQTWRFALGLHPDDAGIHQELALSYLLAADHSVRDRTEGLRLAVRLAGSRPGDHTAVTALAIAYLLNGQPEDAIATIYQAGHLGADPSTTTLVLALAELNLGRLEAARRDYDSARSLAANQRSDRVRAALLDHAVEVFGAD